MVTSIFSAKSIIDFIDVQNRRLSYQYLGLASTLLVMSAVLAALFVVITPQRVYLVIAG